MKRLFVVSILGLMLFSAASLYSQEKKEDPSVKDDSFFNEKFEAYAYGGYNVRCWNIIPSYFNDNKYSSKAFEMKEAGVGIKYSFITIGLDCSSNKFSFSEMSDIKKDNSSYSKNTRKAELLKLSNGLSFGRWSIKTSVFYQEFNTIGKNNESLLSYYTKDQGQVTLKKGNTFNWFTKNISYAGSLNYSFLNDCYIGLGVRYTRFEAPTEVNVKIKNSNISSSGYMMIYTDNKVYDIFFSSGITAPFGKYFSFTSVLSGSFVSSFYPKNDYFDINYKNPWSFDSFSVTGVFSYSCSFNVKVGHVKFGTGCYVDYYLESLDYKNATVKDDMTAYSLVNEKIVYSKGQVVNLSFAREDLMYGYFFTITAQY